MKFEVISVSLLASLMLCSCSKPVVDDQKTAAIPNTPNIGQKPAPIEQPAMTNASPQKVAISSSQLISDHFATDKNSSSSKLHNFFLEDVRDASWAYQGETVLKQRLGTLASTTSVEISQVECRSTMCEVIATTSDPATIGTDVERWQDAVYGSRGQLEQAGLAVESIGFKQNSTGQVVIVTHLIRRK